MTPQQQAHSLISYYEKAYLAKYKRKPKINRYADKWGFTDVLQDIPIERVRELIDFYFLTAANHTLRTFFNSYDTLLKSLEEKERDVEIRRKLRQESKQRSREWIEKYGDKRSEVN